MAPIRSKRKKSLNERPGHLLKRRKDNNNGNGRSERMVQPPTATEVSKALLLECFGTLKEGIWWRVLPLDDMYDDIVSGIGIDWQYLLPLLVSSGLLFTKTIKSSKRYLVSRDLWNDTTRAYDGPGRLEMGYYQYNYKEDGKNKTVIQDFICRGRPIFKSPTKQLQKVHAGIFVYHQLSHRPGGAIRRGVTAHASTIVRTNYIERVAAAAAATAAAAAAENTRIVANVSIEVEPQIQFALALDLGRRPRMNRSGTTQIVVHKQRQAKQVERLMIITTAKLWGWEDDSLSSKRRVRIARAVCKHVAYDHGYERPITHNMLSKWEQSLRSAVLNGSEDVANDVLSPQVGGSKQYLDMIEKKHPLYLVELFRYAQGLRGGKDSFKILADTMNDRSDRPGEVRSSLHISRFQLQNWFIQNNGKQRSPIEKPLDTDDHKRRRLVWVAKYYHLFVDAAIPMAHLDEKWFYITNRRRQIKVLPPLPGEPPGINTAIQPKMRNRRYPVKVMFMGVVANPIPLCDFDGKIFLERISKQKITTITTHHQRFSDDVNVNVLIKNGGWISIVQIELSVYENAGLIGEFYDLDDAVIYQLVFVYRVYVGNNGKTQLKYLTNDDIIFGTMFRNNKDNTVPKVPLTIEDIKLVVRTPPGAIVEEDCSCDSNYMLKAMVRVGAAMRDKYHWISMEDPLYLNVDNAGGHGSNDAVTKYTEMLLKDFNIIIIHQVPRSPFTNLLDLGVWCSLQARVEKQHYQKRTDVQALAKSVMKTWNNDDDFTDVINRVWNRLRNVLALIVEGGGGNELVETKRGKKFRNLEVSQEFLENNYVAAALAVATPPATTTTAAAAAAATDAFILRRNDLEDLDDDDEDFDVPLPLVNKFENIATNIATDGNTQMT